MTGTIWLIVEDENDGKAIRAILKARQISVNVKIQKPIGNSGGISRLANQLNELIETAKAQKQPNDCIAVLHDFDSFRQQDRRDYDEIAKICKAQKIVEVIARDELEAWFLADSKLCKWLGEKPKNWDQQSKPSDTLRSWLQSKKELNYRGVYREKVFAHLAGDGDQHSKSMREALRHLEDAPCTK